MMYELWRIINHWRTGIHLTNLSPYFCLQSNDNHSFCTCWLMILVFLAVRRLHICVWCSFRHFPIAYFYFEMQYLLYCLTPTVLALELYFKLLCHFIVVVYSPSCLDTAGCYYMSLLCVCVRCTCVHLMDLSCITITGI